MSLLSVPFVGTGADTALHVVAGIVLLSTVGGAIYGVWRLHELPISKAHNQNHHQIGLITVLTWIGFVWHWVWVLAVIIAFADIEKMIVRLRDIWKGENRSKPQESPEKEVESC
ncbi:MFS transporter [Vibrio sp. HN007]|uniref:MFS transporter n=1 Tax=Vibrio iocasae TaxID=3098914 RepID=UPI0035D51979